MQPVLHPPTGGVRRCRPRRWSWSWRWHWSWPRPWVRAEATPACEARGLVLRRVRGCLRLRTSLWVHAFDCCVAVLVAVGVETGTGNGARRAMSATRLPPVLSRPTGLARAAVLTNAKTRAFPCVAVWVTLWLALSSQGTWLLVLVCDPHHRSERKQDAGDDSDEYDDFGRKKKKYRAGKKWVVLAPWQRVITTGLTHAMSWCAPGLEPVAAASPGLWVAVAPAMAVDGVYGRCCCCCCCQCVRSVRACVRRSSANVWCSSRDQDDHRSRDRRRSSRSRSPVRGNNRRSRSRSPRRDRYRDRSRSPRRDRHRDYRSRRSRSRSRDRGYGRDRRRR